MKQANEIRTIRRKLISKLENHQVIAPTSIPTNSGISMMKMNNDNPKCEICKICIIQQMRYTLYHLLIDAENISFEEAV